MAFDSLGRVPQVQVGSHRPMKCDWSAGVTGILGKGNLAQARPLRNLTYISPDSAFAIHYDSSGQHSTDTTGIGASGTPGWVMSVAAAMTTSRDLLLAMGLDPAIPDDDGIYDVYLTEFGGGTYGQVFPETDTGGGAWTSYMSMDNDFADDENYYTHGLDGARVTAAHGYFHAVHFAYGFKAEDAFLYELSSTWFEDHAFPEVNDWIYWYDPFGNDPSINLTKTSGYDVAIFGHYLTEKYGIDIWQQIWGAFRSTSAIAAITASIASYGDQFVTAWADFVARLLFNSVAPEFYFHADQALLAPANPGLPMVLPDSSSLVFHDLEAGSATIRAFKVEQPTHLRLELQTAPPIYAAQVAIASPPARLDSLTVAGWRSPMIGNNTTVVLVLGGTQDSLVINATHYNTPPEAFALLSPSADTLIYRKDYAIWDTLAFSWQNAVDPDGDTVVYHFESITEHGHFDYDLIVLDTAIGLVSMVVILAKDFLFVDTFAVSWKVTAIAGTDSVAASNSPWIFRFVIDYTTGVADNAGLPGTFALHPAYPNPFNPSTTIGFDLPEAAEVSLRVYDLLGREVAQLTQGRMEPGRHAAVWNGQNAQGREVPTGVYIARLVTPTFAKSIKLVLLK